MAKLISGSDQKGLGDQRIGQGERLELSVRDSEAFVEALLNPRPVNGRLRETIRRYREVRGV